MTEWLQQLNQLPPWRTMGCTHNHLYIAPHRALRSCIAHYTLTFPALVRGEQDEVTSGTLTLLPDISGCFVFIPQNPGKDVIWGATTHAATVEKDFDEAPVRFFVEFRPGGSHRLTGLPMHELTDQRLSIEAVLPALYAQMKSVLVNEPNFNRLLARVDSLLLQQLLAAKTNYTTKLFPLLCNFEGSTVRSLAEATGYSERHLNRLFQNTLGVSVKKCARVLRVNKVLKRMQPGVSLAAVAQEAGYFDQAHFNHDFKTVCGVSPTGYLTAMSAFYKETFKF